MIRLKKAKRSKRRLQPTKYSELRVIITAGDGWGRKKSLQLEAKPAMSVIEVADRILKGLGRIK